MTFREKLLALVAGAGVGVWGWWYLPTSTFAPKCTTDTVEVQKALDQSSQDLQGATGVDNLSKCSI
jgi:hypothetical protein